VGEREKGPRKTTINTPRSLFVICVWWWSRENNHTEKKVKRFGFNVSGDGGKACMKGEVFAHSLRPASLAHAKIWCSVKEASFSLSALRLCVVSSKDHSTF
jgi:hypothetical protein